MSQKSNDVDRLSKLLDDAVGILKESVKLLEERAKDLEIEDEIVENVRSLVGEVEASIKPAKQRLSEKYDDLTEVGLTGQQLIPKLAVFERLRKNFYSSLDAFKRGTTTLSKLVGVLKKLLGVLEAILSSLASVIPAGHPALEAKTIIHGLLP